LKTIVVGFGQFLLFFYYLKVNQNYIMLQREHWIAILGIVAFLVIILIGLGVGGVFSPAEKEEKESSGIEPISPISPIRRL
jgi:hypothetical protein